jgi:DNA-binding transcriptional ArsR family regulator
MSNVISGNALRDRILAKLSAKAERTEDNLDWLKAISVPSHRELLTLIAQEEPGSIGQLAELAGKAQPNVSRSLSALASAGLVEIETSGRVAIPRLTTLGLEKLQQFRLVPQPVPSPRVDGEGTDGRAFELGVSASPDTPAVLDRDFIQGSFTLNARIRDGSSFEGTYDVDIVKEVGHLTHNWWRVIYRADAPYHVGVFRSTRGKLAACSFKSTGRNVEVLLSRSEPDMAPAVAAIFSTTDFENLLLDSLAKPVVLMLRSRGRYDRPLESNVSQIEETRSYPNEYQFARTAGALGLIPTALSEQAAVSVRELVEYIDDEDVRLDFASAVLGEDLNAGREWVAREMEAAGQGNRLPRLPELRKECLLLANMEANRPYKIAISLAKAVRKKIGLACDTAFGGLNGLAKQMGADEGISLSSDPPGSLLAFQGLNNGEPILLTSDRGPVGSTFVMARAIGDYIAYGSRKSCVTELYTERQALGRAFAAELLAPSEAIISMVHKEDKPMNAIARHFGVGTEVVRRQYDNNSQFVRAPFNNGMSASA